MFIYEKKSGKSCRSVRSIELESLLESVNTSAGINKLLLTGEERMALGANFYLDILLCGTCLYNVTASAGDGSLLVYGMDTLFHDYSSFRNILRHMPRQTS